MALADGCFYFPTRTRYEAPETYGLQYEPVWFSSTNSTRLHGWFFPARGAARGTVVHCHGNAGNISGHFPFIAALPAHGWNALCFDYRGYGESTGRAGRAAMLADAHAAIDYVRSRPDVATDRVLLFGQSIGGTVALVAATQRRDLPGVAVEGAFSSYRREALHVLRQYPVLRPVAGLLARHLISDALSPADVVGRISPCPIPFICGTADPIVDYRQTLDLYEASRQPKDLWVVEGGGHCDALLRGDGLGVIRLTRFLHACLGDGDVPR